MQLLRLSTAATVTIGPILDSTGAEYTGAVIGDISIRKHDGTSSAALASAATLTHDANGMYKLVLTTGNTDTLGRADFHCNKAGYQMPPKCYDVVPAMIYDSLVLGTDRLDTNVTHIGDTAQTARDIGASVLLSSGTGTGQVKIASGYLAMTWADIAAPTTTVNLSGTTFKAVTDGVTLAAAAVQAIWDAATSALSTVGSIGKLLVDNINATISSRATPAQVNTEADTALADAKAGYAVAIEAAILDEGDATALLAAIASKVETFLINEGDATATMQAIATAVWANAARTLTAGTNIQLPSNGLANVTAWTVAITGNITGNLSGSVGSVTGLTASDVGAIKAKTDNLPADPAGLAGLASAHGAGSWATATGFSTLDAAGVRTAVGLGSANLDTQLGDLPTNAELATSQAAADDATIAAIAAAWTTAMTESYNADGAAPSPAQALFVIMQGVTEFAIAGTTKTVKKLDGSTTAYTETLDSSTAPTAITRAT